MDRTRVLFATAVLAVLVCALWFTGGGERRPAKGNVLGNPPGMTDRLVMLDSADAWRRGSFQGTTCREGSPADVRLTESPSSAYPRTGAWTSSETETDFPFTELIPSWNAFTPPGTGVRVDVRVRQRPLLGRPRWSPWLFIGSWGRLPPGERRTVSFEHGVVNVDNLVLDRPADAFQVRVRFVSFDTDPPATPRLRRLAVSYSGVVSPAEAAADKPMAADRAGPASVADAAEVSVGAPWARSLPVPFRTQKDAPPALRGQICSPTSVSMVLAYRGVDRPTVENAQAIYDADHDMFGNWNRAVARAGELGLDAWLTRFRTWDAVKAEIARGQPVIAAIQFKKGEMPSAVFGSTNGHLIVIRGFTPAGDVIVNDPASKEHGEGAIYKADQLGGAWFEHGGVGYIIRGPTPRPATIPSTNPAPKSSVIALAISLGARVGLVLPRPVLRETRADLATAREAGGGEGDVDHQVFATPAHRVRQITLTLTLSRSTVGVPGKGSRRAPGMLNDGKCLSVTRRQGNPNLTRCAGVGGRRVLTARQAQAWSRR